MGAVSVKTKSMKRAHDLRTGDRVADLGTIKVLILDRGRVEALFYAPRRSVTWNANETVEVRR